MRLLAVLLRKEFAQILRDKLMMRQMFLMPVIQLLVLSSAATFEVKTANVYVVDRDQSTASRALVQRLQASGRFRVRGASPSMSLANEALLARSVGMILSIPADFERELTRGSMSRVQLVLNAEDGAAAGVTQSYAAQIIRAYASDAPGPPTPERERSVLVDVRVRGWYNPTLDYRDYMVPGILVQLVTVIGTLLTAMNIVREKEIGTLEQLSVTPLPRATFVAGKLLPLWIIAMVELALGLVVARYVFGVPMVGSLLLVFFAAAVYLLAALGIGLAVSTIAQTQQQAMFVTFFIVMIYLLMSGLFTPVRSMPDWAQWMAQLNPVKHFIEIMRAVMLKGAGLAEVSRQLGILALIGTAVLSLAIRQHDRRTS
ncbi:MAG TPA: ABC transporter permease [Gemmatimonadaceae bacterium]|nr:ABC transporter permease [Gemmatimonadaceae bacterium]